MTRRVEQQPTATEARWRESDDATEETHPAFGVAVVTRTQGTPRSLFQSDVLHGDTINLSIQTAIRGRDLNHDWVHPVRELVEVEMSLSQWGALVSSVGIGSGVPVTIRRTEHEVFVPTLPYQPRIAENLAEVNEKIDKLLAQAKESLVAVNDAVQNGKGARAVKEALRTHTSILENAQANAAFAVKSMVAAGEKVTSQVRADIEAQILTANRLTSSDAAITAPEFHYNEITVGDED